MNNIVFRLLGSICAFALSGCMIVQANGHALRQAAADNRVHIVVVQSVGLRSDRHVAALLPALVDRLPADFKHNGVDASVTLLGFDDEVPAAADTRTLVIAPAEAGSLRSGGSWVALRVELNDAKLGRVWEGRLALSTGGGGSYDGGAVDRAAIGLMEQLRDAKLFDLPARRPEAA